MRSFLCLCFLLLMLACEDPEPAPIDPVIVDGVLVQGQPVTNFRLWRLSPLGSADLSPLEAEAVVIRDGSTDYFLSPQTGAPGAYFDASASLQVMPGTDYQLIVVKGEELIFGGTRVPLPPQGLAPSQSQYALNAADRQNGGFFQFTWTNSEGRWFVGKLLRISPPLTPIDPVVDEVTGEVVTDVVNSNLYQIPFNQVNYYGVYAFILYAVNLEYLKYFGANSPDVRVQQYTNIFNGLGIFTAITPDTTYFEVIPR